MPISRLQLLMQLRMGSHAQPVEQGRLARSAVPRHLRRCTLCGIRALEDERHFDFDCPHFAMRTGLCSCLSLLQQGNETAADRLLVPVPHEHTHAPRSILEQAKKSGPDVTDMRAIKHTMELIAYSLSIANGAPAKVARDGWPGKTALLTEQSMGTKSELHQSPESTDAHWQLIAGCMRMFMWHRDQKSVCHCLIALLQRAQT